MNCPRCRGELVPVVSERYLTCLGCPLSKPGTIGVLVYISAGDGPAHPLDGKRATVAVRAPVIQSKPKGVAVWKN